MRDLLPETLGTYIEPFVGSGAMYFALKPQSAILSDLNSDLIAAYLAIQTDPDKLVALLRRHKANHDDEYYYNVRAKSPTSLHGRAARLIYLNRTCWNGLYRVNQRGSFNVPRGTKDSVLLGTDNFSATSKLLKKAELLVADFETTLDKATTGDFVFVDPPYTVRHNLNGFIKYNDFLFKWSDQERLHSAVERARSRGAKILVLNANHKSIHSLYKGAFRKVVLSRNSVLAADPRNRQPTEELAIFSW